MLILECTQNALPPGAPSIASFLCGISDAVMSSHTSVYGISGKILISCLADYRMGNKSQMINVFLTEWETSGELIPTATKDFYELFHVGYINEE